MSAQLSVQSYEEVRHSLLTLRDADTPGWWLLLNQSEAGVLTSEGVGKMGVAEFSTFLLDDGCVHVVLIAQGPPERRGAQAPAVGSPGAALRCSALLITYLGPACRVGLRAAHEAHTSAFLRNLLPNLYATLFTCDMADIEPFVAFAEAGCPPGGSELATRFHHPGTRIHLAPVASGGFVAYRRQDRHLPARVSTVLRVRRTVRRASLQEASVTGILRSLDEVARESEAQGRKGAPQAQGATPSPARQRASKIPRFSQGSDSSDRAGPFFTPPVNPRANTIDRARHVATQPRRQHHRVRTPPANINLPGVIRAGSPSGVASLFAELDAQEADASFYPDPGEAWRRARERQASAGAYDPEESATRKIARLPRRANAPPAQARPGRGASPLAAMVSPAGRKANFEISVHASSEEDSDRSVEQLVGSLIPPRAGPTPDAARRAASLSGPEPAAPVSSAALAAHMRSFTRSPRHTPSARPQDGPGSAAPDAARADARAAPRASVLEGMEENLPGSRLSRGGKRDKEKRERHGRREKKERRKAGGRGERGEKAARADRSDKGEKSEREEKAPKPAKSAGAAREGAASEAARAGASRAVATADGSPSPALKPGNPVFVPPAAREAVREIARQMDDFIGQRKMDRRLASTMEQAVDGFQVVARFAGSSEEALLRDVRAAREALKRAGMAFVVTTASDRGILGPSFDEALLGIEPYLPSGGAAVLRSVVCDAKKTTTLDALVRDGERWCGFLQRLL